MIRARLAVKHKTSKVKEATVQAAAEAEEVAARCRSSAQEFQQCAIEQQAAKLEARKLRTAAVALVAKLKEEGVANIVGLGTGSRNATSSNTVGSELRMPLVA